MSSISINEERALRAKELTENQRYIEDKLSKIVEPMIINVLNNRHHENPVRIFMHFDEIEGIDERLAG